MEKTQEKDSTDPEREKARCIGWSVEDHSAQPSVEQLKLGSVDIRLQLIDYYHGAIKEERLGTWQHHCSQRRGRSWSQAAAGSTMGKEAAEAAAAWW